MYYSRLVLRYIFIIFLGYVFCFFGLALWRVLDNVVLYGIDQSQHQGDSSDYIITEIGDNVTPISMITEDES